MGPVIILPEEKRAGWNGAVKWPFLKEGR